MAGEGTCTRLTEAEGRTFVGVFLAPESMLVSGSLTSGEIMFELSASSVVGAFVGVRDESSGMRVDQDDDEGWFGFCR